MHTFYISLKINFVDDKLEIINFLNTFSDTKEIILLTILLKSLYFDAILFVTNLKEKNKLQATNFSLERS